MNTDHDEHKTHHPDQTSPPEVGKILKVLTGASVIQVILLVIIAFQLSDLSGSGVVQEAAVPSAPNAGAEAPAAPTVDMKQLVDNDYVLGDKNAPVTIVEFSDYQCPFCKKFWSDSFEQIKTTYIDTGKVKFIYRDFPLGFHQNAQKAAEAAECAGEQGKYFGMHDKLFQNGQADGTGLNVADLKKYAQELGLNTAKFNECLDSGKMKAEVLKDFSDGQRAGVQGTPSFYINGQMVSGAQPFSVFEQVIDAALAQ